jgi:hypothetical protein
MLATELESELVVPFHFVLVATCLVANRAHLSEQSVRESWEAIEDCLALEDLPDPARFLSQVTSRPPESPKSAHLPAVPNVWSVLLGTRSMYRRPSIMYFIEQFLGPVAASLNVFVILPLVLVWRFGRSPEPERLRGLAVALVLAFVCARLCRDSLAWKLAITVRSFPKRRVSLEAQEDVLRALFAEGRLIEVSRIAVETGSGWLKVDDRVRAKSVITTYQDAIQDFLTLGATNQLALTFIGTTLPGLDASTLLSQSIEGGSGMIALPFAVDLMIESRSVSSLLPVISGFVTRSNLRPEDAAHILRRWRPLPKRLVVGLLTVPPIAKVEGSLSDLMSSHFNGLTLRRSQDPSSERTLAQLLVENLDPEHFDEIIQSGMEELLGQMGEFVFSSLFREGRYFDALRLMTALTLDESPNSGMASIGEGRATGIGCSSQARSWLMTSTSHPTFHARMGQTLTLLWLAGMRDLHDSARFHLQRTHELFAAEGIESSEISHLFEGLGLCLSHGNAQTWVAETLDRWNFAQSNTTNDYPYEGRSPGTVLTKASSESAADATNVYGVEFAMLVHFLVEDLRFDDAEALLHSIDIGNLGMPARRVIRTCVLKIQLWGVPDSHRVAVVIEELKAETIAIGKADSIDYARTVLEEQVDLCGLVVRRMCDLQNVDSTTLAVALLDLSSTSMLDAAVLSREVAKALETSMGGPDQHAQLEIAQAIQKTWVPRGVAQKHKCGLLMVRSFPNARGVETLATLELANDRTFVFHNSLGVTDAKVLRSPTASFAENADSHFERVTSQLFGTLLDNCDVASLAFCVPPTLGWLPLGALRQREARLCDQTASWKVPSRSVLGARRVPTMRRSGLVGFFPPNLGPTQLASEAEERTVSALGGTVAHTREQFFTAMSTSKVAWISAHGTRDGIVDGEVELGLAQAIRRKWSPIVVLATCRTGVSDSELGVSSYPLTLAITVGGAHTTIGSHFPLSDTFASSVAPQLMEELLRGPTPVSALSVLQSRWASAAGPTCSVLKAVQGWAAFTATSFVDWGNQDG